MPIGKALSRGRFAKSTGIAPCSNTYTISGRFELLQRMRGQEGRADREAAGRAEGAVRGKFHIQRFPLRCYYLQAITHTHIINSLCSTRVPEYYIIKAISRNSAADS